MANHIPKHVVYIPHDAGFFSVFNMLMGCICQGTKLYPYYNKKTFLDHNNLEAPKHFCYLEDADSSNEWFKYFQPITYYENDTIHQRGEYMCYDKADTKLCEQEFCDFKTYKKMMHDNLEYFVDWRKKTHKVYARHISLNQDIQNKIDQFWKLHVSDGEKVIAVHYRHPSHYCEAGAVYFHQYFEHIDAILKDNPLCKIFVASDNDLCIMMMEKKYGKDRIFYWSDIDRVGVDNILEWVFAKTAADAVADNMDFINGKGYQMHYVACQTGKGGSRMAIDVIQDVYCLAKAHWFVHMTSNLALAVSYINPEVEMRMVG